MIQIKKWGSRKIQNSLPLMNTSKTHLHEEQFSLKTNETGRKTLIRLKVYERSMRSWIEREKKQSGCDLCSRERTGKRSSVTRELRSSLRREVSSRILGTPTLGSDTGKTSPLHWLENE